MCARLMAGNPPPGLRARVMHRRLCLSLIFLHQDFMINNVQRLFVLGKGAIVYTVQLTRNLNASLEHKASHSRVEELALDKILASTHALEHSHSNTASENSRSTRKVPQRNTTVLCVHNCFAPPSAVSLARLSRGRRVGLARLLPAAYIPPGSIKPSTTSTDSVSSERVPARYDCMNQSAVVGRYYTHTTIRPLSLAVFPADDCLPL